MNSSNTSLLENEIEPSSDSALEVRIITAILHCTGILFNLVAVIILIYGAIRQPKKRYWARTWLLVNNSIICILLYGQNAFYAIKYRLGSHSPPACSIVRIHLGTSSHLLQKTGLLLLVINVVIHIFNPARLIGRCQMMIWGVAIVLSWGVTHSITFLLHTVHLKCGFLHVDGELMSVAIDTQRQGYILELAQDVTSYAFIGLGTAFAIHGLLTGSSPRLSEHQLQSQDRSANRITAEEVLLWRRPSVVFITMATICLLLNIPNIVIYGMWERIQKEEFRFWADIGTLTAALYGVICPLLYFSLPFAFKHGI